MTIQAVIFDMDGVLIDSEPYWYQSGVELAREIGKNWTKSDHQSTVGLATEQWAGIMVERMALSLTIDAVIADMKQRMIAHYDEHLPVLPGALEAVHIAARNYKIGLASGSPVELIRHVIDSTHLNEVLKIVVHGDMVKRGKPAPDIYIEAARQLGVSPPECIGVEDSPNGIRALKAAGMKVLAVPSSYFPLPEDIRDMADVVLPSLELFSTRLIDSVK